MLSRHAVRLSGSFIRDHPYTIATISSAVNFFSKGTVQALFLKHDGFVGAIGAHLSGLPIGGRCERMASESPTSKAVNATESGKPPEPRDMLSDREHPAPQEV